MNIHSIYSLLIFQLFKTCIQPLLLYHHLAFILKLFYMFRFIIYIFGYPIIFTLLLHVHVLTRLFVYLKSSKTVSVVLIFNNKDTCITHLIIQLLNYAIFMTTKYEQAREWLTSLTVTTSAFFNFFPNAFTISYSIPLLSIPVSKIEICRQKNPKIMARSVFILLSYGSFYLTFLHLKCNFSLIMICYQYF